MKKTYISPELVAVELHSRSTVLSGSLVIDGTKTVSGTDGGWVKEESSSVTNKSVWDEEW